MTQDGGLQVIITQQIHDTIATYWFVFQKGIESGDDARHSLCAAKIRVISSSNSVACIQLISIHEQGHATMIDTKYASDARTGTIHCPNFSPNVSNQTALRRMRWRIAFFCCHMQRERSKESYPIEVWPTSFTGYTERSQHISFVDKYGSTDVSIVSATFQMPRARANTATHVK